MFPSRRLPALRELTTREREALAESVKARLEGHAQTPEERAAFLASLSTYLVTDSQRHERALAASVAHLGPFKAAE
jgi:hypothetical protein